METLDYIVDKFNIDLNQPSPIFVPKISRTKLAKTLFELNFKVGVEIGVAAGEHAKILCENNPNLKLYCVDPWLRTSHADNPNHNGILLKWYGMALKTLEPYNCVFMREKSMSAISNFADYSLDFVFIDGNHNFINVAMDIANWERKVKAGGIIYGHDFVYHPEYCHVESVVKAYTNAYNIKPWFVFGDAIGSRTRFRFTETPCWLWTIK
jgi:predicted O-methyltransferase YrrM